VKVLLLSAYAAESHVHWRRSLQVMMPDWEWVVLELPPRYFAWRVRGNPLYWSLQERHLLEGDFDLLLATSMVDLATLRGLVPSLARVPTAVYFHENQFDYPPGRGKHSLLEAQMVSLYSSLAADSLVFNSAYNRDSFLAGCDALLARLPDKVPAGIVDTLRARASVLPVALLEVDIESDRVSWPGEKEGASLRVLWTGRFEYDKGGDRLLEILRQLEESAVEYELALVGQQFRDSPPHFDCIARDFKHRLVQFGYVESRKDYLALLRGADLLLSTALHEFQGLAVLEAVAAGCIPIVPDRLAYREIYPPEYRYASHPDNIREEAGAALERLAFWSQAMAEGRGALPDITGFSQRQLAPRYRSLLQGLAL
jgi:glycosyltransferase involved in cell wall biosynthesis